MPRNLTWAPQKLLAQCSRVETLGIIGGTGLESTLEYYRGLIAVQHRIGNARRGGSGRIAKGRVIWDAIYNAGRFLLVGTAREETRDGLILGGIKVSLILRDASAPGLPVLDTTQIHVDAAVERLLRD